MCQEVKKKKLSFAFLCAFVIQVKYTFLSAQRLQITLKKKKSLPTFGHLGKFTHSKL